MAGKSARKPSSSYCATGKASAAGGPEGEVAVDPRGRLQWKATAEVKEIEHHRDLAPSVHEALWYTDEQWDEMEKRNVREAYEEQTACEYGYAKFKNGYYEYVGENSSGEEDEGGANKDDDEGAAAASGGEANESAPAASAGEPLSVLVADLDEEPETAGSDSSFAVGASPLRPVKAALDAEGAP
jgi:hypothetical protein